MNGVTVKESMGVVDDLVQVEMWAEVLSENFLRFSQKLNRFSEEARRNKERMVAEITKIGGIGEWDMGFKIHRYTQVI